MIATRNINVFNYQDVKANLKFDKREIMSDAWYYFKKGQRTFSEALKIAWSRAKRLIGNAMEVIAEIERNVAFSKRSQELKNETTFNPKIMREFYDSSCYKGD